jgi:hypothetical protein
MFPPKRAEATRIILDISPTGFEGYKLDNEQWLLFASSSSMSTFLRMMSDFIKLGNGNDVEFQVVHNPPPVVN